jgi:RHS repeat-associated protein
VLSSRALVICLATLSSLFSASIGFTQMTITPDGQSLEVTAGQSVATFTVTNDDSWPIDVDMYCAYTGSISSCQIEGLEEYELVFVPAHGSTQVNVSFTANNGTGTVSLEGLGMGGYDNGWFDVQISPAGAVVAVTPDGLALSSIPAASRSQIFTVQNSGWKYSTYDFTSSCTPPATASCTTPSSKSLAAGASTTVSVSYQAGPTIGQTGTVRLDARVRETTATLDAGFVTVTVVPNTAQNTVSVADANSGITPDRDLCLTFSVISSAAVECGDLRIVHGITGARTMNKTRAPVLLYNSRLAQAAPVLAAHVTLATTAAVPTRITANLAIKRAGATNWVIRASGEWHGAGFLPGIPTRVALSYEAVGEGTGLYDYRYDLIRWDGTTPLPLPSATGQFILVDRSSSPFGAGWWISGLEQLLFVTGGILWVGGDGSARLYTSAGTGKWVAPTVDRPDTLVQDGTGYARILSQGLVVKFNSAGQHVNTVTRLGHLTAFGYDGNGRLAQIVLPIPTTVTTTRYCTDVATCLPTGTAPPAPIAAPTYTIAYPSGQVKITAPPAPSTTGPLTRETILTLSGGVVQSIRDADSVLTQFQSGTGSVARRVSARTDRRGTRTRFDYTTHGHLVTSATTDSAGAAWIETRFNPVAEAQGLGQAGTTAPAVAVPNVLTLLDGPRLDSDVLDHTRFWVNRFGAPTKIRNALGHETVITRADGRFPALVTEVTAPNGFKTRATYDARGNTATSVAVNPLGDNRDAVTQYTWQQQFDLILGVTLPEGNTMTFGYHANTGNRLWQQDDRGVSSRVNFAYYLKWSAPGAPGLLRESLLPGGARDSLAYDPLGNLAGVRAPDTTWTRIENDNVGRTTVVRKQIDKAATPKWQDDSTTYDRFDRATRSVSYGPLFGGTAAQKVIVKNIYNVAGQLDSLQRMIDPVTPTNLGTLTTHWRYDPAGRVIAELAPDNTPTVLTDNPVDSTIYDKAGNVVRVSPRRRGEGAKVTMQYDALNRLIERKLDAVTYSTRHEGIAAILLTPQMENPDYPRYGVNAQGKYVIAQDVATFGYDVAGNMTLADNGSARVRRGYYPGGLLRQDSLYIRAVGNCPSGSDPFACHEYILELTYDLNGRRIKLKHPAQLISGSGAPRDYVAYTYDAQTGALKTVTDILNNQSRYHQNLRNELDSLYLPSSAGQWREGYGYDLAGNRIIHKVWNTSMALKRETAHTLDARGKALTMRNKNAPGDSMTVTYSGLGHVVTNRLSAWGKVSGNLDIRTSSADTLTLDALGNLRTQVTRTKKEYNSVVDSSISHRTDYYEPRTGRLVRSNDQGNIQVDTTHYDSAGNIVFTTTKLLQQALLTDRASYYASDGSLQAADFRSASQSDVKFKTVFEEYRYDALGRRVLVRTRRYCHTGYGQSMYDECNLSTVRRTVWDGSQELWEIQMPGRNQMPVDTMENDVAPVKLARTSNGWDLNRYFGRVTYTHGPGVDQPLGLVRLGYADWPSQKTWKTWSPFAVVPLWNSRGQPDDAYFPVGGGNHCDAGDPLRCVFLNLPAFWTVYGSYAPPVTPVAWQGTLMENKTDKTGTLYRRYRVYDPVTGRFTQEDPIGFAGGLNLYGFANGDPVNFSDPFGLMGCPPMCSGLNPRHLELEVERMESMKGKSVSEILWDNAPVLVASAAVTLGPAAAARIGSWLSRGGGAAGAASATGAAAGRIPFDGFQAWGRSAVGWGQNAAGAAKAMAEMTVEKAGMLDPSKVQAAKTFYENAVANQKGGAAASARVELMQKILELQKK